MHGHIHPPSAIQPNPQWPEPRIKNHPDWDPGPCSTTRKESALSQITNPTKTYHTSILSIPTLHLLPHIKAHALINRHIGNTLRTLQITLHTLAISLLRNSLKQQPPNTPPLCLRTNSNNITEIVSPRIIPNSSLRLSLSLLPDPVSVRPQPTATKVPDVIDQLAN